MVELGQRLSNGPVLSCKYSSVSVFCKIIELISVLTRFMSNRMFAVCLKGHTFGHPATPALCSSPEVNVPGFIIPNYADYAFIMEMMLSLVE